MKGPKSKYNPCRGCGGEGWVENSRGDVRTCPVCYGSGRIRKFRGRRQ